MRDFLLFRALFAETQATRKALYRVNDIKDHSRINFNGNFFPEASRSGEEVDLDRR